MILMTCALVWLCLVNLVNFLSLSSWASLWARLVVTIVPNMTVNTAADFAFRRVFVGLHEVFLHCGTLPYRNVSVNEAERRGLGLSALGRCSVSTCGDGVLDQRMMDEPDSAW